MALRDQPYIPLYIKDIMTDEKLNECCASTHGIYIKGIMCLMHKSKKYGKILIKQIKDVDEITALSIQLVKHFPYKKEEIKEAIKELLKEGVCYIEKGYLCQGRMIRDNIISIKRAKAGYRGGKETMRIAKANAQTKGQARSEDASAVEDAGVSVTNDITISKSAVRELQEYHIRWLTNRVPNYNDKLYKYPAMGKNFQRWLKAGETVDTIKNALNNFFADTYALSCQFSNGLFVSQFQQYKNKKPVKPEKISVYGPTGDQKERMK